MNQYAIIFEEIEAGVYMDKSEDYEWCGDITVTFRKDVTPGLPLRRPGLSLAPGSDWAPLLAC